MHLHRLLGVVLVYGNIYRLQFRIAAVNALYAFRLMGQIPRDIVDRLASLQLVRTAEYVEGSIAVLGPGMDGDMGGREKHHAGHAVRSELVEMDMEDFHACRECGIGHEPLEAFRGIEFMVIAPIEIKNEVLALDLLRSHAGLL